MYFVFFVSPPFQALWYEAYVLARQHSTADVRLPPTDRASSSIEGDPLRDLDRSDRGVLEKRPEQKNAFFWVQTSSADFLRKGILKCDLASIPFVHVRNVTISNKLQKKAVESEPILDCLPAFNQFALIDEGLHILIKEYVNRANGKQLFEDKYGSSVIRISDQDWPLRDCETLFVEFGQYITAVEIDGCPIYTDIIVGFVSKYCPNIEKIRCSRFDTMTEIINRYDKWSAAKRSKNTPPFRKLRELVCDTGDLVTLKLRPTSLPSLVHFSLNGVILDNREKTEAFFASIKHIRKLSLNMVHIRFQPSYILRHLTNLGEIDFGEIRAPNQLAPKKNVKYLSNLMNLTKFKWHPMSTTRCMSKTLMALNNAKVPLKVVDIKLRNFNPAYIEQLSSIEELKIVGPDPQIVPLVVEHVMRSADLELIGSGLIGQDDVVGFRTATKNTGKESAE